MNPPFFHRAQTSSSADQQPLLAVLETSSIVERTADNSFSINVIDNMLIIHDNK